eukprot:3303031-Pyramimonas_sp.AAC.1
MADAGSGGEANGMHVAVPGGAPVPLPPLFVYKCGGSARGGRLVPAGSGQNRSLHLRRRARRLSAAAAGEP